MTAAVARTIDERAQFMRRHQQQLDAILRDFPELRYAVPPAPVVTSVPLVEPAALFAPLAAQVEAGDFRLRDPVPTPRGLAGPFRGHGGCMTPVMPGRGALQWFDPSAIARDGDLVLTLHDAGELFDLVERGRKVPGWLETYGEQPSPVACHQLRHVHGHHLLLTNSSSKWLGKSRVLGVLRFLEIGGRPMYGSGLRRRDRLQVQREARTAHSIDYTSGANVDSLEPAEAAADQTTPRVHDLINPGLETGTLEGWTALAGPWSVVDTDPHSGTYHLEGINGGRIANDKLLPVNPGDIVIGRGVGKVASGTATLRILIEMFDAAGGSLQVTSDGIQSTATEYAALTLRALAPANAVAAQFEFSIIFASDAVGRFDSASMVHVPSPIDTTGQLIEGAAAGDGSTTRSVARGPEPGSARHQDVVTFDPPWSSIPTVRFVGGGISFSPTLNDSQAQDFQALNLSGSGFTARLVIKELVGSTTLHTDSTVSTPSSPSGLDHSINKSQSAEAHDDKYTFQFDVTVNNPSASEPGVVTVGIYTNDGSGWVQRTTRTFFGNLGESQTVRSNVTETVTVNGLGLNDDFGINIESGNGSLNFDSVKYETASQPATETATPAGAPDVEYLVIGG